MFYLVIHLRKYILTLDKNDTFRIPVGMLIFHFIDINKVDSIALQAGKSTIEVLGPWQF